MFFRRVEHDPRRRSAVFVSPRAFAFQNEKHFFVLVKMIGRAARRDRADKLRRLSAADLIVDQYAVPAIGGGLGLTVGETHQRGGRVLLQSDGGVVDG